MARVVGSVNRLEGPAGADEEKDKARENENDVGYEEVFASHEPACIEMMKYWCLNH